MKHFVWAFKCVMRISAHAKCMKSKQAGVRLQECENVIVGKKERLIASDE
jgi:hypothetical protein